MTNLDIYERLGVKKLINAAGTYTVVGGSRMSNKTLEDMISAAKWNVDIRNLQEEIHKRIAELTKNEAAFISNGAASGLYLSIAAAISLKENQQFNFIPRESIFEKEILVFSAHRNPYDWAIKQLGVKLVHIGYPNDILPMTAKDLINAISNKTVAIYYVAGSHDGWIPKGALAFEEVSNIAEEYNIPLIVDAAAQLPPTENLWNFTEKGATVALFSGGKDLAGPQSSGLIVGKSMFINIISQIGFPNYGIGRMLKVGREEMVGLFSALEQYLETDFEERVRWCESQIKILQEELKDSSLFEVKRTFPNEAGQPLPRAFVSSLDQSVNLTQLLLEGENAIYTTNEGLSGAFINPMTLKGEEIYIIAEELKKIEQLLLKGNDVNGIQK